ncbi:MAG TPA: hydrogenase/urease maturation nickel metallochaperone HypA [Acidimicrobiia bacterium]|nr:hydrogenase/urease maturation nickel metallochaperone HypA [Acidimicrobiia bacterium]
MHELALADAVIKAALRAADDAGIVAIERIVVSVGELQQIDPGLFRFSLTTVIPAHDRRLSDTAFDVAIAEARFACRSCGATYGRSDIDLGAHEGESVHFIPELLHAFAGCPRCASPDFEIVEGRGILLTRIEGRSEHDSD